MEMIKILLGSGALLTDKTLCVAVGSGNKDLVRLLLERGADVNSCSSAPGETKTTPLSEAIRLESDEIVGLLERYGAVRLNDQNQFSAAISAASEVGNISFIERLLQLGGKTRKMDLGYGLGIAVKNGHVEAAAMLIDAGADMNQDISYGGTPLMEVLNRRDAALVHLLLDAGALPDHNSHRDRGVTLSNAVAWGDLAIVETLIFEGADVNISTEHGDPPLTLAVKQENHALIKLLVDNGADVNLNNNRRHYDHKINTPLEAALGNEDVSLAGDLLHLGADPIDTQALGKAMVDSPQFLDFVLEKHRIRYPEIQAKFGGNALIRAIELKDEHMIKVLLEKGLDGKSLTHGAITYDMKSPFGHAIEKSTVELMDLFLQRGCNPNSIVVDALFYTHRLTALLAAVDTDNVSKVKLLHRYKADVNSPFRPRVKRSPL